MLTSVAVHAVVLALLMLVGSQMLLRSAPTRKEKELDVVFYHPPATAVPEAVLPPSPLPRGTAAAGALRVAPAPGVKLKPNAPAGPDKPAKSELPPAPAEGFTVESDPEPKAAKAGILAFRDKLAGLTQDKIAPRLGAEARHGAGDDVGQTSARSLSTANTPGSSGGINLASLNRSVGGGDGIGGMPGVAAGHATSSIASIAGSDRPKARSGAGSSRTDEEIQIVFDRYKASFYRLYNRELRNNPALKGQMVLRLTIEPDGSVSMCALQSSDMNAPDLAAQVASHVRTMNFGAKEGALAVTIVYPIDFLQAR
jgi:hypothetical protein